MPTSFKDSVVFGGVNNNFAGNAPISKLEVEIFIGEKFNTVVFPPIEFQGNENDNIIGPGLSLSNSDNNIGFKHVMNKIEFQGHHQKSESTLLFIDNVQIQIPDSQNYVIARQVVQANLPFWS